MFNSFGRDEFVSNPFHQGSLTTDDEDFEAVVVVQMNMEGGDNDLVVIVLDVCQGGLDVLFVVIVNKGDGAGDLLCANILPMLNEASADKISHSQGTIVVTLFLRHLVELLRKRTRDRDGKADNAPKA